MRDKEGELSSMKRKRLHGSCLEKRKSYGGESIAMVRAIPRRPL